MTYLPLFAYSIFFFTLAYKKFRLAVGLLIIGLPAYLIRFKIGPLPSTLLELNFGIIFLVWLIKYAKFDFQNFKSKIINHKFFFIFYFLFFISSVAGIIVSDQWYISLGQWRAYFLEPMLLFIILVGRLSSSPHPNLPPPGGRSRRPLSPRERTG